MSNKHVIGALQLIGPEESRKLAEQWNDTASAIPTATLAVLFEQQVASTPDAEALTSEGRSVLYRELNERANRLAHYLIGKAVGPEDIVAICMPRSVEAIVAMLAIVKAGAAYLPLNLDDPLPRLEKLLGDSNPVLVLTTADTRNRHPDGWPCTALHDPETAQAIERSDTRNPTPEDLLKAFTPLNAAYVMYTSGSTGSPKGVVVPHRAIVRLVCGVSYVRLDGREVILQFAPISFDASTFEIWGSLLHGARLVVFTREVPALGDLGRAVRSENVTTLWLTAALFHAVVENRLSELSGVRQLLVGGDVLRPDLVGKALLELPECRIINGYGPTEATTFSCCHTVDPKDCRATSIPIGRPIGNTRVYVLDERLDLTPVGVTGELYIAGIGLARGYLMQAAATAERFVADPYSKFGTRMYRSGDRVRWLAEGRLEFLGRADQQVKIRGFRVELGEVEAALREQRQVHEAVVVNREDKNGDKVLVGYVVLKRGQTGDPNALRRTLLEGIPEYMVPAVIVLLDELPMTPNGKLDRKALPAPAFTPAAGYRGPRTPEEEILCGLFAEVLGSERVGIDDSFFDLGGHSLLAVSLVSRLGATLGLDLNIEVLFESPRVEQLSARLWEVEKRRMPLVRQNRPAQLPLSYAQQRLWFLDRLQGSSAEYNVPVALRLTGDLDRYALELALNMIVERHESLRTHFAEVEGEPVQIIEPELRMELRVEDLSGLEESAGQEAVKAALRREAAEPFDLARGPVLRPKLLKLGEQEHILLRTMHHIVSDGWSQGVFNRELMVLYEAFREGRENPLKPLEVQYADFALWQRQWLEAGALQEGLTYWKEQLAGIPDRLELPADRPRPAVQTFAADMCQFRLEGAAVESLKRISRENQATLFMTLLAGFGVLLSRYSGQDDIVVGTPIANRQDALLEEMIGFFVNSLVMRVRVQPEMSFRELLGQVRQTALGAYRHQDVPFERLVEELSPQRTLDALPLFQIVFAVQNAPWKPQRLRGLQVEHIRSKELKVRTDLEVHAYECDAGLDVYWFYNRDLFDRWRIEQMARHYVRVLDAIQANIDQPVDRLDILEPDEQRQILEVFNATYSRYEFPSAPQRELS